MGTPMSEEMTTYTTASGGGSTATDQRPTPDVPGEGGAERPREKGPVISQGSTPRPLRKARNVPSHSASSQAAKGGRGRAGVVWAENPETDPLTHPERWALRYVKSRRETTAYALLSEMDLSTVLHAERLLNSLYQKGKIARVRGRMTPTYVHRKRPTKRVKTTHTNA